MTFLGKRGTILKNTLKMLSLNRKLGLEKRKEKGAFPTFPLNRNRVFPTFEIFLKRHSPFYVYRKKDRLNCNEKCITSGLNFIDNEKI